MNGARKSANLSESSEPYAIRDSEGGGLKTSVRKSPDWRMHGVKVIPGDRLASLESSFPGFHPASAINYARVGARKLSVGTVSTDPGAETGAHHHGELETAVYVVRGRARMRWGERLEFVAEAGPGDFIFVPPYVPHQETNANEDEQLEIVILRSGEKSIFVNLDIPMVEHPEDVPWTDPIHQ